MRSVFLTKSSVYRWIPLILSLALSAVILPVRPVLAVEPCHQEAFKQYLPYIFSIPFSTRSAAQPTSWHGTTAVVDFNGDGCADAAIGIPNKKWKQVVSVNPPITIEYESAGAVQVLYGDKAEFFATERQLFYQGDLGGTTEAQEYFGQVLAVGDFNGDRFTDLAIGTPSEAIDNLEGAGVVHIIYGSRSGLTTNQVQTWTQDYPNVPGEVESGDFFGAALTAGDFDNDGYADLAVGAPGEMIDGAPYAGTVTIFVGSAAGLTATNSQLLTQDQPEQYDQFGVSVTAHDFNGDGFADLAVGVSGESKDGTLQGGAVTVCYGTANGLAIQPALQRTFYQDDIGGIVEPHDFWGTSLASGDLNGDGYADLAVGAPLKTIGDVADAGAVSILYGASGGLTVTGSVNLDQNALAEDRAEGDDRFGYSMTIGYFNNDAYADLVIGVPGEDIDGATDAGAIQLLYGSASGPSTTDSHFFHQTDFGLTVETGDQFGFAVLADDFNRDGFADLLVSAPFEDDGTTVDSGIVNGKLGSATGIVDPVRHLWTLDPPEANATYGWGISTIAMMLQQ